MYKTIIMLLLFVFLAGAAKGVSDKLQFHYGKSVFSPIQNEQWWNPGLSWKNKYRDYDAGDKREAFLGSRTLFVWTTDAWHLAQTVETLAWVAALLLAVRLGMMRERRGRSLAASTLLEAAALCGAVLFVFYASFMLFWGVLLVG